MFRKLEANNYKDRRNEYSEVAKLNEKVSQLFNKKIWRVRDVADFLGCSIGHVYNLTSDEKIPKIKKGKFIYFIPEVILDWIIEGDLN